MNNHNDDDNVFNSEFNPHICNLCGCRILEYGFRDDLSLIEYNITGLCQKCQDEYIESRELH